MYPKSNDDLIVSASKHIRNLIIFLWEDIIGKAVIYIFENPFSHDW